MNTHNTNAVAEAIADLGAAYRRLPELESKIAETEGLYKMAEEEIRVKDESIRVKDELLASNAAKIAELEAQLRDATFRESAAKDALDKVRSAMGQIGALTETVKASDPVPVLTTAATSEDIARAIENPAPASTLYPDPATAPVAPAQGFPNYQEMDKPKEPEGDGYTTGFFTNFPYYDKPANITNGRFAELGGNKPHWMSETEWDNPGMKAAFGASLQNLTN